MKKEQKDIAYKELEAILPAIGDRMLKGGATKADARRFAKGFADVWLELKEQLIPIADAAKQRQISRAALYDLIARGRLNVIDFGGKKFLLKAELEAFKPELPGPSPKEPRKKEEPKPDLRFAGLRDWLTLD